MKYFIFMPMCLRICLHSFQTVYFTVNIHVLLLLPNQESEKEKGITSSFLRAYVRKPTYNK